MIAQLILVGVVSSAYTRHINEDPSVYRHSADFPGGQNSRSDLNAFGQPEGYQHARTERIIVVPKTNLHRHDVEVNSDSAYVISERSQKLRINPMALPDYGVRIDASSGGRATQHMNKYIDDSGLRSRSSLQDNSVQNINKSTGNTHHETQLKHTQGQGNTATVKSKNDSVSRSQHATDKHDININAHDRSMHTTNGKPNQNISEVHDKKKEVEEPVTERKPFTNAPKSTVNDTASKNDQDTWVWSDAGEPAGTTPLMDLEDRAAFSGDGCPTGKTRIVGTNMCVEKH